MMPAHDQIQNAALRRAVELMDAGEAEELRGHLEGHPGLVHERVELEGWKYFPNASLLEFVAENPVRRGRMAGNVVEVARVILEAGAKQDAAAMNGTLGLVSSGCVARECGAQGPLIDLLCGYGADANSAMATALAHMEVEAAKALLQNGAKKDLLVAAAFGDEQLSRRLLPAASGLDRHRALALASQFGHASIVGMLLDAGEDPNRYNPAGFHAHSTPLHQAALGGHEDVVRLLVDRGARLDAKDTMWQGTPAGWAKHEGRKQVEEYLRAREAAAS